MEIEVPPARAWALKDLHARRCYLLGITDPARVEKLWAAEVARRTTAKTRG